MLRILDNLHNLWNHIAATLDLNPVPDLDAQFVNKIHVVQSSPRNHSPANWHRLQPRHGRKFPSSANLRNNVFNLGDCSVRRELVRDGPTRSFTGESELLLK